MSDGDPPSPESDLDHIVDDATPREESLAWTLLQLRAGRDWDELLAELIESGWPAEEAEGIVEEARRATRGERGTVTRDQVAKTVGANYRAAMGNGLLAGLPTIAAIRRLLFSIATLRFLRRGGR